MLRAVIGSFVAVALLAFASAHADEDAYTIKLYKSKKGDKTEHEATKVSKTEFNFVGGGMNKKGEEASEEKEAFTEEILEKKAGDKRATKLVRTYTVAEKVVKGEKGETKKFPYAGQTVLIEKKADKYELSIKGKALTEKEAPELFRKFNKKDDEPQNEDLLPDGPVKVGGTWTIPAAKSEKIFKAFGDEKMKLDAKKSTITGKLLKAYKKDGAQFGVLEITMTVVLTEIDLGGQSVKTSDDSKMVLKGTIDTCIDGTLNVENEKMEMTIDVAAEIPTVGSITIKGTATGTEKSRAVK